VAVPKRRTSRSKRDSRRANHDKITAPTLGRCDNCGDLKLPHRVCAACGFFNGQSVLPVPDKTAAKEPG
jgi:large subunit ribosomal protein L32